MKMEFNRTDVFTILGTRGSGKTYLSNEIRKAYPRVVIFDCMDDEIYEKTGIHVTGYDDFSETISDTMDKHNFTIIYHFKLGQDKDEKIAEFNEAMRLLYHRGDVLIVIEEVHTFANTHNQGLPQYFEDAVLKGRHQNLALLCSTQRPAMLNKNIISQSHHIFCSHLTANADLEYMRKQTDMAINDIKALKHRQFLYKKIWQDYVIISNDLKLISPNKK